MQNLSFYLIRCSVTERQSKINYSLYACYQYAECCLTDTRAEVNSKAANFLVQHNIPLSVTDHLNPLFKNIFPDSSVAKALHQLELKQHVLSMDLFLQTSKLEAMQSSPYALAIDGSNDNGLEKMNPLTVRIFDLEDKKVITNLLDMCLISGE